MSMSHDWKLQKLKSDSADRFESENLCQTVRRVNRKKKANLKTASPFLSERKETFQPESLVTESRTEITQLFQNLMFLSTQLRLCRPKLFQKSMVTYKVFCRNERMCQPVNGHTMNLRNDCDSAWLLTAECEKTSLLPSVKSTKKIVLVVCILYKEPTGSRCSS